MKTKVRPAKKRSVSALQAQSANLQNKAKVKEGGGLSAIDPAAALNAAERLTRLLKKPAPADGEWNLFLAVACSDLERALSLTRQQTPPTNAGQAFSAEEMERWHAMRSEKLRSPVKLYVSTVNPVEDSDTTLIELLAETIRSYTPQLVTTVLATLDDRRAALYGEQIQMARNIAGHVFKSTSERRAMVLPGLSGEREYGVEEILFWLADTLDNHRQLIREEILAPMPAGLEKCLLAEALAIAQSVMDHAVGDDEVEAFEEGGPAPLTFRDAWQAKADYYMAKLGREAAEQAAELAQALAHDKKMLARQAA